MDIEVLNLQANADSIDKATASINNLATAIDKIDKKTSEITKSTFDLAKSLDGATKSAAKTKESIENVGEATKPLKGVERVIDNLQNTLKVLRQQTIDASDGFAQLGDGFTRSQARALANARALGATADQLKSIADLQKQLNALTSDPFDQSVGALSQISKIRSELERTMAMTEKYGDLTQEQLRMMSRGYAEIEQRIAATGGSMNQLNKETDEFTKSFLENAHAINVSKEALKAKNKAAEEEIRSQRLLADATKAANAEMMKSWAGGIGMQSDELKQMSSYYQQLGKEAEQSTRMRANAEQYVQDKLERTLFINKQLEAGFGQGAANALFNYKKQIDAMGLSADQSAVKMEEFQNAVMQNQSLRSDRSPFKKMSEDIQETNRQVNHLARAVSVQLGDVFVSLASGMNPFVVAMQQGDQIRFAIEQATAAGQSLDGVMKGAFASMANSFVMVGKIVKDFIVDGIMAAGKFVTNFNVSIVDAVSNMLGFGNAATNAIKRMEESAAAGNKFDTALLGLFKTMQALTGIALIGTVSALGMLITAMIQADLQQTKLAKSIGQYGASLGITAQQAREMAVASEQNTSKMVDAIGAIAKAGGFTQEQLQMVAESAVQMNKVFGTSIEDVIAKYKEVQKDPVDALIQLQIRTGNVNQEVIKLVRQLKEQGDTYNAIKVSMDEYAAANKRTTDQTVQNLGVIETMLNRMAEAWSRFYKDIQQIGTRTLQEQINSVRDELNRSVALTSGLDVGMVPSQELERIDGLRRKLNELESAQAASTQEAKNQRQALSEVAALEAKYADDINNAKPAQIKFAEKQLQLQNDYNQALKNGASPEFLAGLSGLMQKNADEYLKSLETTSIATTKKTDEIQAYFKTLLEQTSDLSNKAAEELAKLNDGYSNITASQKLLNDLQDNDMWKKLPDDLKQIVKAKIEENIVDEKKIQNQKAQILLNEQLKEYYGMYRGIANDVEKEAAEIEHRNSLLFATEDQAKEIQRQYEKNLKITEIENKYLGIRTKLVNDYLNMLRSGVPQDAALEQFNQAIAEVGMLQEKELSLVHERVAISAAEDYAAKFKEIQGTVTDIIATALFEGGKAGSKKLKDVLKSEFKKYVIKVFIEPVVGQVMGSLFGTSGGSFGGGSTGGSTGGIFGFPGGGDIGSNVVSFLDESAMRAIGGGYTSLGEGLSSLSGTINSANTYLKSIPGFEGGVSSALGYANAASTAMDGKYSKALGQAIGTYLGGPIGAAIGGAIGDAIGWEKKPSDKTSSVTVDLSTNAVKQIWDMGGKKTAPQEQKDANVLLSQIVGGFANLAGITGELVTAMGSRDGIRVAITGGFKTPEGAAGGGAWLGGKETIYSFGSDLETAIVRMFDDLVDEGKLDQALIDTWRRMGDEIDGTTRSSGELVSVLNLLTSGYEEMDIERANLLQTEGETLEQAYLRMLNVEKALKGVISTENEFTNSAKALSKEFERLGLAIPTSAEALGSVVSGLDLSSANGQSLYKTLMQLAPAFLQVEAAFESNYNLLLSEQELLDKKTSELRKTFYALGVAMPKNTQELRRMIDAVNTTSSANVEFKAKLLSLVPAFLEISGSIEGVSNSFANFLEEQKSLEMMVLELQGNTAKIRELELKAINPLNRYLQEYVWALEDSKIAIEKVVAAENERASEAQRIATETSNLETQILQLAGNTNLLRNKELASLSPLNRGLQQMIYRLQDAQAAIQGFINTTINGISAQISESNKLSNQAKESAQSYRDAGKSLKETAMGLLYGIVQNGLSSRQQYTTSLSSALSGNAEAMKNLPALATAYIEDQKSYASSLTDFARMSASVASSLNDVAAIAEIQEQGANYQAMLFDINTALLEQTKEQLSATNVNLELLQSSIDAINSVGELISASSELQIKAIEDSSGNVVAGIVDADGNIVAKLGTTSTDYLTGLEEQSVSFTNSISGQTTDFEGFTNEQIGEISKVETAASETTKLTDLVAKAVEGNAALTSGVLKVLSEGTKIAGIDSLIAGNGNIVSELVQVKNLISSQNTAVANSLVEAQQQAAAAAQAAAQAQQDAANASAKAAQELAAATSAAYTTLSSFSSTAFANTGKTVSANYLQSLSQSVASGSETITSAITNIIKNNPPHLLTDKAQLSLNLRNAGYSNSDLATIYRSTGLFSEADIGYLQLATNVQSLYYQKLGKKADEAGLTYWTNQIYSGDLTNKSAADMEFVIGYALKNKDLTDYYATYSNIIRGDTGITNLSDFLLYHWQNWGSKEGRKFAVGGAFTNSIVSGPTAFNMGLMGEAGPEAIMPLTNVGGSLGVRAEIPSNDEIVFELRALRSEVAELKAANVATARNTHITRKQLERWDGDGMPEVRDVVSA